MSREEDLLLVLLGLQMKFFTAEQIAEAGEAWAGNRSTPLADLLEKKGILKQKSRLALEMLVADRMEQAAGDAAKSLSGLSVAEKVRDSLLGLPLAKNVKDTLLELKAEPGGKAEEPELPALAGAERYRLGPELGRGGLGCVVAAEDTVLGREVAVKMMIGGAASAKLTGRFLREGEIAGRLSHPNVIPIHDIGVREEPVGPRIPGLSRPGGGPTRKVHYFVMTRIFGRDLKDILHAVERGRFESGAGGGESRPSLPTRIGDGSADAKAQDRARHRTLIWGNPRRSFSRPRLLRIFQDVCLAVAYAHDHGVIHRDLKPANVMVGDYGEVYVVDWGLAKLKGQEEDPAAALVSPEPAPAPRPTEAPSVSLTRASLAADLTMDGEVLGTPAYMPPEQADGRITEVDEKSDIYSLGAILYEILTLQAPYDGSSAQNVLAKVLRGDLTPPSRRIVQARREAAMNAANPKDALTFAGEFPDPECDTLAGASIERPPGDLRAAASGGEVLPADPIPPELEEIVLRAMARDKAKRYAKVMDLHEDMERFLDGEKERERNRQRAAEKVAEGRTLVASIARLREEFLQAEVRVVELGKQVKPHWPPEQKADWWEAGASSRRLSRDIVRTFGEAAEAFQEALGFERDNREARAELAELYWDQYLREEAAGDENRMLYFEGLVRKYNDGQFDARLKGDGTLSVATRHFPCRCLLDGRKAAPEEIEGHGARGAGHAERREGEPPVEASGSRSPAQGAEATPPGNQEDQSPAKRDPEDQGPSGNHPMSGRALDGHPGAEGLPELEPAEPVFLRIHGPACRAEPLDGADAWLFRYEERKKLLVPVMPTGVAVGATGRSPLPAVVPGAVLDRLFDRGSPFRPAEGLYLGKTPLPRFKIPMGSYLLVVAKDGFHPVRVPVCIGRLGREDLAVTLYREGEIPEGFVQVPAGRFSFQGDKENPYSLAREIRETEDFFLSRFPVTCREYRDFLASLARKSPKEAAARAPREAENAGYYWPAGADGVPIIPTADWLAHAPEDLKAAARRLPQCPVDWEEDWPAFGVSWEDMMHFAAWRVREDRRLYTLPHETEREKAARGPDGRIVAWGMEIDATYCNMNKSRADGPRPCPVDSYPTDESPYGVRGLSGNSRDLCLNDPGPGYPGWRLCRGGGWLLPEAELHASFRTGGMVRDVGFYNGGRLVCVPRLRSRT